MKRNEYLQKAETYLQTLCGVKPNRCLGSKGNCEATDYVSQLLRQWDFKIDTSKFECLDYISRETYLKSKDRNYEVYISPYSLGCDITAELVTVSTVCELEKCECKNKILLMKGELCAEQLMPKNFPFYNLDHHKKIYLLLEDKQPSAIITAIKRKPEMGGALYPFPLIVDGDFNIPNVYCSDKIGEKISEKKGELFNLKINSNRISSTACNVIAQKNVDKRKKIVICAHIDAYENSPGASDNASGIVVELLLAEMLSKYQGDYCVEIIAFNGEDHYSAGGQMDYLHRYEKDLERIILAINVDGVGYKFGKSAYSLYEFPDNIKQKANMVFSNYKDIIKGEQWYNGDHMIFVKYSKSTIAFTAEKVSELMATYTHTSKDTPAIIDCEKLVDVALALQNLIIQF